MNLAIPHTMNNEEHSRGESERYNKQVKNTLAMKISSEIKGIHLLKISMPLGHVLQDKVLDTLCLY